MTAALLHTDSGSLLEKPPARLAELLQIKDPQHRLAKLVHDAPKLPRLEPRFRIEANRVEGCLVRLWFVPELRDGKCFFRCDSDAVSLKAVGGLLCELYSGRRPEEIAVSCSGYLKHLGILHQLAENRRRTIARVEGKSDISRRSIGRTRSRRSPSFSLSEDTLKRELQRDAILRRAQSFAR